MKQNQANKFIQNDSVGLLSAELLSGNGWILKGLLRKEKVLHCILKVTFSAKNEQYSLVKLTAEVGNQKKTIGVGATEFFLSRSDIKNPPEVKATITAVVKCGFMQRKELKCSVKRNF